VKHWPFYVSLQTPQTAANNNNNNSKFSNTSFQSTTAAPISCM
jgi:hypothetical protein